MLAETCRPANCVDGKQQAHMMVNAVPGQAMVPQEVVVDGIYGAFVLAIRIKAFFHTVRYTTIGNCEWFTYGDC
eukprot:2080-Pyramimonas_sp.AAC.1